MKYSINNLSDFFQYYQSTAFEKDIPGMISLYADNVLIFDMWGNGFNSGIKEWSAIITEWLSSLKDERVKVSFEMIEIHEDGSTAFASALIQFQAISPDDSVLRQMKNRITLGFIKKDGSWKVKHQHTSAPIDSNLTAILSIGKKQ